MNNSRKNIILIGGGGHCKSCIDVIESTNVYNIIGILDRPSELGKKILNYEVIGNDSDYEKFKQQHCSFLITVGQIKSSNLRSEIFSKLKNINAKIETILASTAIVSKYSKIGIGSIIMHRSIVNAGVEIGENCIINTSSILEHDVTVGNNTHISTNVVVNGECKIGSNVFIGSASCVSNNLKVEDRVLIGAGSLVLKNILHSGTYVGNPMKKII